MAQTCEQVVYTWHRPASRWCIHGTDLRAGGVCMAQTCEQVVYTCVAQTCEQVGVCEDERKRDVPRKEQPHNRGLVQAGDWPPDRPVSRIRPPRRPEGRI